MHDRTHHAVNFIVGELSGHKIFLFEKSHLNLPYA
jgi:hypothetical protein